MDVNFEIQIRTWKTIVSFNPYYILRPEWYVFKGNFTFTFRTKLLGFMFYTSWTT